MNFITHLAFFKLILQTAVSLGSNDILQEKLFPFGRQKLASQLKDQFKDSQIKES